MKEPESGIPGTKKPGAVRRRVLSVSQESLTNVEYPHPGMTLPVVIQCAVEGVDLGAWGRSHRDVVERHLLRYGAILFSNFDVQSAAEFERFITAISGEPLEYRDCVTPRSQVTGNIYTSTDYPADQNIELHNESTYAFRWPLKVFFFCSTPATWGGETPIADCRKVFERIPKNIRDRFIEKQLMYVRNFGGGLGDHWETVFRTSNRAAVEKYCREARTEFEWHDGNRLRTRQIRPAVARHPRTGEMVWFGQIISFHMSTIEPAMRELLLSEYKEEEFPKNVYFGDGSPIEAEALDAVRRAYREETVTFPWQKGDVLMLDNMLVAHGRAPFAGPRKVFVGMSEPLSWENA